MLVIFLQILFVLACFLLIMAVLLQQGKGGGISGAFGIGGASQTIFGASGAGNVLTRATWILGGAFMLLSLILTILSGSSSGPARRSILEPTGAGTTPVTSPVVPGDGGASPAGTLPGTELPAVTPSGQTAPPPAGTAPATGAPAANPIPGTSGGTGN